MRVMRRLLIGFVWLGVLLMGCLVMLELPAVMSGDAAPGGASSAVRCTAPGFDDAARINRQSLSALAWRPFHRAETGWETYAPRIGQEIGSACDAGTPGFAAAFARWQLAHRLQPNGQMDETSFSLMNYRWEMARPFVRVSAAGICPAAPAPADLAWALPQDGYLGKMVQLRPAALDAYRRMVADARADLPGLAADHRLLTIVSGYRDPATDTDHCGRDGNCDNIGRATCSAHRTGLAVDLYLSAAPGHGPTSSDDANRLFQSRSAAYAWMIVHAGAYGFVNYPFEPWHWEWIGASQ